MRQTSRIDRALGIVPWIPAVLGIGALVTLLVIVAIRLSPRSAESGALPPPQPPVILPEAGRIPPPPSAVPESPPPPSRPVPVGRTSTVPPPVTTRPAPPPTATRAASPPAVTGRYEVVDAYPESFIGQVAITNRPGADRAWTVTLTFPAEVGDLRTSWLESLPQPTLTTAGRTFTWRSTTPLAAGTTGLLRFQFERTGDAATPSRCTANGRACD